MEYTEDKEDVRTADIIKAGLRTSTLTPEELAEEIRKANAVGAVFIDDDGNFWM